jgi:hypothetical protein
MKKPKLADGTAENTLSVKKRMSEVAALSPTPAISMFNKSITFSQFADDQMSVQSEILKFGKDWGFDIFTIYD